ncbi:uncharacterized protein LOC129226495 [Uloborus diversus]|uniref:uncharacterized protein LOC129226495 n=1 Tax=Uloborus diversus TaxID=327109 RepID=UPI0024093A4B|nr:uncharacterized protein LOC129226495 [Uloborus diversus]
MVRFTKKLNDLIVLVHFFEEDRFSIMKLKDCLPKDTLDFMNENFNIEEWNRDKVMQVSWDGICYPARFLQFSDDRRKMNIFMHRLEKNEITVNEVPILQCNNVKTNDHLKNGKDNVDQMKRKRHLSSSSTDNRNTRKQSSENVSVIVKEEADEGDETENKMTDAVDNPTENTTMMVDRSNDVNENHQMKRRSCLSSSSTTTKNKAAKKRNSKTAAVSEGIEKDEGEDTMTNATYSPVGEMILTDDAAITVNETPEIEKDAKQWISEIFPELAVDSNIVAGCNTCKFANVNNKFLKKQCKSLETENYELNGENAVLRAKLKIRKEKYRNLKSQMKEYKRESIALAESNLIKIGNSTFIDKNKLILCRTSDYSKFTGDLLDFVFGRDILSKSCMKGMNGTSKTPLPAESLQDILSFVSSKFNVAVGSVRASIRQKLNICHKAAS